jgi:hypothetical protein
MNIEIANTIPMAAILNKIGLQPVSKTESSLIYNSPLKNEKASLIVHFRSNTWEDKIDNAAGSAVDFVCLLLKHHKEDHTQFDALRWIRKMFAELYLCPPNGLPDYSSQDQVFRLKEVHPLTDYLLIHHLEKERFIPVNVAKLILKEADIRNTETRQTLTAIVCRNQAGGYSAFNPYLKATIGRAHVTFVRGQKNKPKSLHIFTSAMDYLSAVAARGKPFLGDAIILHTLSNMPRCEELIHEYGYTLVYTWLDNSSTGQAATKTFHKFLSSQPQTRHFAMNKGYAAYKDLSAWHVATCRAALAA